MLLAIRPPDEEVRALAERILAQPDYARWRDVHADFLVQLARWIEKYLSWMDQLKTESPVLFSLFVAGLLVLALVLLAHIAWSIRAALAVSGPPEDRRRVAEAPRWVEEAERLARQRRFLEGAHHLVLGSIDVLVKRGVIELGRADSNRVLRDRIHRSLLPEALGAQFFDLLDAFEKSWFRDRLDDGELYAAWRELHSRLRDGAWGAA